MLVGRHFSHNVHWPRKIDTWEMCIKCLRRGARSRLILAIVWWCYLRSPGAGFDQETHRIQTAGPSAALQQPLPADHCSAFQLERGIVKALP
jgi:hypothetical protein